MANKQYIEQDRGDNNSYKQYIEAMDAISVEKVASASVFFSSKPKGTIVDVGMASGSSTAILANLFPENTIIGIDINPTMVELAQQAYQAKNLSFRVDDGEKLESLESLSIDGFFNCSAIHHITSYNNYDINRAYNTLARQTELLREGGVIIVRDFVKPEIEEVFIELSTLEKEDRPSDCDLLLRFSKTARSLSNKDEQGFPIEEVESNDANTRKFKLYNTDAIEFIRRKDYYPNWDIELQEEYGYFTQQEFEDCFRSLGLRIILSTPIYNQWIINNRYKNEFRLYNLDGTEIGYPPTNYIIVGEKVNLPNHLSLVRYLPPSDTSFLEYSSYQNKTDNSIYEVVSRPNEVKDIIPYIKKEDGLFVVAKKGYPRPIINASQDASLDNKHFSGYITEGIAISKEGNIIDRLEGTFNLDCEKTTLCHLLNYYPSPGGINEHVSSWSVSLNSFNLETIKITNDSSGFSDLGFVQIYNAAELLNTAQTGALIEARLEMNIYQLFFKHSLALPKWLGEKIIPRVIESQHITVQKWDEITKEKSKDYAKLATKKTFLQTSRAYFSEIGAEGCGSQILEFVYPKQISINTLITIPIYKQGKDILIGLEKRSLPTPQIQTGNSTLFTVPAKRLAKEVKNLFDLYSFVSNYKIGNSTIVDYFKLGEKYFPSIGVTPEQVYPYAVTLDRPDASLYWVSLNDLWMNMDKINDAHLLICTSRLTHALKI